MQDVQSSQRDYREASEQQRPAGPAMTRTPRRLPRDPVRSHQEHRRFAEFADAVRRDRYIGLCYGPPRVGKTLFARQYAGWDTVEPYLRAFRFLAADRGRGDLLKTPALEQLSDHHDRTGIGLILTGMPGIEKRLARYPQLYSPVGFVHHYRPLSAQEQAFVLARHWPGLHLDAADAPPARRSPPSPASPTATSA